MFATYENNLATASAIRQRELAGDLTVSQAERDFAARVLSKQLGSVPDTGLLENVGGAIGDGLRATGKAIGEATGSALTPLGLAVLWPVALIAVAVVVLMYLPKGGAK
jgi:hypothetical protein